MPFSMSRPLMDLFDPDRATEAARLITVTVGRRMYENIVANTPVADLMANSGGLGMDELISMRGGRKPGTLRDSIFRLPVIEMAGSWSATVATDDPIGEYVEYDTRPHRIVPVNATRLRFPVKDALVFSEGVNHPGTRGQHMFGIGVAITDAEVNEIADTILALWASGTIEMAGPLASTPASVVQFPAAAASSSGESVAA